MNSLFFSNITFQQDPIRTTKLTIAIADAVFIVIVMNYIIILYFEFKFSPDI